MKVKELLAEAGDLIDERGQDYGEVENNFNQIAGIANAVLYRDLSAFDIAVILACVKLARMRQSPYKLDNYLDGINYLAFAAAMRPEQIKETPASPPPPPRPTVNDILNANITRSRFRTAEDGSVTVEGHPYAPTGN